MSSALQHDWHFYVMFHSDFEALHPGELLHLISAFLHRSNFIAIDREIKAISFQELPNPDMRTNSKLLTLRELLSELATGTAETHGNASSDIERFIDDGILRYMNSGEQLDCYSPIKRLAAISQQASDLQRFLMDSFQLLMSSVSIAESQNATKQAMLSMEQAERTAKLTQLAFVYIPLTFVTSIFGMNVRELVDPVLPVWVCFVTLFVVAAATAAIFGSYKYRPDNVLRNLLSERYARALGLRRTDVEKGPARS
jgi:Mg2+ and Co2+ transporter CorA